MSIRLSPQEYAEIEEWDAFTWRKECCRLAALIQQQQHLVDHLTVQLRAKDQELGRLEEHIREMKVIASRIVRAGQPRYSTTAGKTTEERMRRIYAGGQDD